MACWICRICAASRKVSAPHQTLAIIPKYPGANRQADEHLGAIHRETSPADGASFVASILIPDDVLIVDICFIVIVEKSGQSLINLSLLGRPTWKLQMQLLVKSKAVEVDQGIKC